MSLNDEQQKEFKKVVRPMIDFLNNHNLHPHMKIIITNSSAELYEGILSLETLDYLKD